MFASAWLASRNAAHNGKTFSSLLTSASTALKQVVSAAGTIQPSLHANLSAIRDERLLPRPRLAVKDDDGVGFLNRTPAQNVGLKRRNSAHQILPVRNWKTGEDGFEIILVTPFVKDGFRRKVSIDKWQWLFPLHHAGLHRATVSAVPEGIPVNHKRPAACCFDNVGAIS